ncbi:hypothetical protein CHUAL_005527 [Chamberlinius hualienensis]
MSERMVESRYSLIFPIQQRPLTPFTNVSFSFTHPVSLQSMNGDGDVGRTEYDDESIDANNNPKGGGRYAGGESVGFLFISAQASSDVYLRVLFWDTEVRS